MSRLARTLGEIYPPGLRILVYLEDFGVWYEDACGYGLPMRSSVERNIETCIGEFAALLRAVSPGSTRALRLRDLIGVSFDAREYEWRADRNRVLSRRVTSQVMPPWTCKGCFRLGRGGEMGVALQSFPLARESRLRFAKGRLRVTRGEHTASVRADVLLPETIPGGSYLSLRE